MDMFMIDRLIIRAIRSEDYYDICEYGCEEDTEKYMTYQPKCKDNINKFIDECIIERNAHAVRWYEFAVVIKKKISLLAMSHQKLKKNFRSLVGFLIRYTGIMDI